MSAETMKLYQSNASPNSRRVRIFITEKGLSIPIVPVDLGTKSSSPKLMGRSIHAALSPRLCWVTAPPSARCWAIWALSRRGVSRAAAAGNHPEGQGAGDDVGAARRAGRLRRGDGDRPQHDCRSQGTEPFPVRTTMSRFPRLVERGQASRAEFLRRSRSKASRGAFCCRQAIQRSRYHGDRNGRFRHQGAEHAPTGSP